MERCIYCDSKIIKKSLNSILFEEDMLCYKCRSKLKVKRKIIRIDDLKVESFFEYKGIFSSLLLQYKECYDEALKDVFLFQIKDYIRIKYHGYELLPVPSTSKKINERGFDHLKLIFESLNMPIINPIKLKEEIIQQGKDKVERTNIIDNYIYDGYPLKKVLIVDDVITTGSSIKGVYKAIKSHSLKIKGLVMAYC